LKLSYIFMSKPAYYQKQLNKPTTMEFQWTPDKNSTIL